MMEMVMQTHLSHWFDGFDRELRIGGGNRWWEIDF